MSEHINPHASQECIEEKSDNSVLSAPLETGEEVLQSGASTVGANASQDVSASSSSDIIHRPVIAAEDGIENICQNFKDSAICEVPAESYTPSLENMKQNVEVNDIAIPEVIPEPDTTSTDEVQIVEDEGGSGGEGEAAFWVQCCQETCGKWRFVTSIGQDINQEPDYWECSMNQVNY